MEAYIVVTSIFAPTEAVKKYAELPDYKLVVVGDKKTPSNWYNKNAIFLSVSDQEKMDSRLLKVLPYNHYCRKMAGYLYAIREKATIIIDTDDDNIPKHDWGFPPFSGAFDTISSNQGFVNIYSYFTDQKIWPRGFPLRLINQNTKNKLIHDQWAKIGIWQALADEDPDVDAIYRLTSNEYCNFRKRAPIVFQEGSLSPMNTQNTAIVNELFPLLYLPCYVTFRFTDILRGIIAQPIMWAADYYLGFTDATVIQKRNPHDYFEDFISEIPMYSYVEKVVELVSGIVKATNNIQNNLFNAYTQLEKNGIVSSEEMKLLECWLFDISN